MSPGCEIAQEPSATPTNNHNTWAWVLLVHIIVKYSATKNSCNLRLNIY